MRKRDKPLIISQWGMEDRTEENRRSELRENMEIIRQCEEAAFDVEEKYPIAARLLREEANQWREWKGLA